MSPAGAGLMAKQRGRPRRSERDLVTVKIDRALALKAKRLGEHRGTSQAEVLSELLEVPIDRAYLQMLKDLEHKGEN